MRSLGRDAMTLPGDWTLLGALGVHPGEVRAVAPLAGGISEGGVLRLALERRKQGNALWHSSRVFKRLLPSHGWLSELAQDTLMREAQLHRCGLLAELPAHIATAIESWTLTGPTETPSAGALLLHDERGHLLREPLQTPPGKLPWAVAMLLDRVAQMHSHFWNDARLRDARLGLMPPDTALLLLSPERIAARIVAGDTAPYLSLASAGWDAFFRLAPRAAAERLQRVLKEPERCVAVIERLPWTLVHGDLWGPNLGWLPPARRSSRTGQRLLLLDWALATAGPVTYDPLWVCGTWHGLDPVQVLAFYRARLNRHLRARGIALTPSTWQLLADAGYLRTTLTCGEALGRAAAETPAGANQQRAVARVRWWAERAARAAERLTA